MNTLLSDHTLLNTREKQKRMIYLIILKASAAALEKQGWFSAPYGGQNLVQEFLNRTQIVTSSMWEEFFSKENINVKYDSVFLEELISEMCNMNMDLKSYLDKKEIQ